MRIIDGDIARKKIMDWISAFSSEQDAFNACDLIDSTPTVDKWHYPSRGEYPKEGDKYLVVLFKDDEEPHIAEVKDGWFKHPVFSEYLCPCDSDTVYAWQYIIPPKEEV